MIGITIAAMLKKNAALLALVSTDNIFPYVAQENTPLPLIIYTIDTVAPEYAKDKWAGDDINFSIVSFSEDYASLQAIAHEVRTALELQEDSGTNRIELTGQQEGFNIAENVFLNKLSFSIRINSY